MAQTVMGSKLQVPLAILAFLAMGAFLVWLGMTAEPSDLAIEEADEIDEELVDEVPLDDFSANPLAYEGTPIQLNDVEVLTTQGQFIFWAALPGDDFYLFRLDGALREAGAGAPPAGEPFDVIGTTHAMSDSVIEAWVDEGLLPAAEADILELHESFFEVNRFVEEDPEAEPADGEDPGAEQAQEES